MSINFDKKFTKFFGKNDKISPIKYKCDHDIYPNGLADAKHGDWVDLRAAEDVFINRGDNYSINLGIAMKLPRGYEALLLPRSSTYRKYGIIQTNSMGVIDNSYSGENDIWKMPVIATRDTHIRRGERICQFRIQKRMDNSHHPFMEVEHLDSKDRGGFGSTGTN